MNASTSVHKSPSWPRRSAVTLRKGLVTVALVLAACRSMSAATATFSDTAPPIGANDIGNLTGASSASENVSQANSAYLADDQAIVGQTFTTGPNALGYQVNSITIRHVTYDTYALVPDLTYTIRVTQPSGTTLSVVGSETAVVAASEPGNIQTIAGGNNLGPGSGIYVTFTFSTTIVLTPNTTYGYDIGGGSTRHYWESDGTISNAYEGGTAYASGSGGQGNTALNAQTGDRLFVILLTPIGTAVPPAITSQPKSLSLYVGQTARFSANASGSPPLSYQWQKDNVNLSDGPNISGATTSELTVRNLSASDVGGYTLMVSNSTGAVTSGPPATLTLVPQPDAGTYTHAVLTNGPVAHWRFNETGDPTTGTLVAFEYVSGLNGNYQMGSVVSAAGPRPSDFPGFESTNNAVQTSKNNGTATWVSVPGLNLNTNTVTLAAWIRPNVGQEDATGIFTTRSGTAAGLNFSTDNQIGYLWNSGSPGTYNFASGLRPPTNEWSFVALVIEPTRATIYLGADGVLKAAVNPITHTSEVWAGRGQIGGDQEAIDWRIFDGLIDEVSVFNQTLSFDEINALYGAARGSAQAQAPGILNPPESLQLFAGRTARFSVDAIGSSPLGYQWKRGGTDILGATNSSFTIQNVSAVDVSEYTVVVSNTAGAVTSSPPASLSVITPNGYRDAINAYNPVAYWRLNETGDPSSGTLAAFDNVRGLNALYTVGAQNGFQSREGPRPPTFSGFESNNAATQTTGTGDNTTPTWVWLPSMPINTNTVTFTLWINPNTDQGSYTGLIMNRSGAGAGIGFTTDNQIGYTWNGSDEATWGYLSEVRPPPGEWSFVAVVIESTRATFYNYSSQGLSTATNLLEHTNESLEGRAQLGGDQEVADWRIFNGLIDEVAIFDYALTAAQLQNLYTRATTTAVALSIQRVGTGIQLIWPQGPLLEADQATGPWTTNNTASPYLFEPVGAQKFYRLILQ